MPTIAIVGAGMAGLHLALHLQKEGLDVSLYVERTPDEIRAGRLPSTVALSAPTRARQRALGVAHWERPEHATRTVRLRVAAEPPFGFVSHLQDSMLFIDMRVYLPRLLEDFAARGGRVVKASLDPAALRDLAAGHDLVVVATGRAGLSDLFPTVPERSPHAAPLRRLFAGIVRGLRMPDRLEFMFQVSPGHGELFENQYLTLGGVMPALLIEAIPGGALDPLTRMRYEDDPARFDAALLEAVLAHAPLTAERVDRASFGVAGPRDHVIGAVRPVVRRAYAALGGGRFALALGDLHITHDPITGQGANMATLAAWLAAERIAGQAAAGAAFDEAFCADLEDRLWEALRPATEWTNASLLPPPDHALALLAAASRSQSLADAFATNFAYPDRQWAILSSPEATASFIASHA
ncbi:styrene monooxygenase/indole monooxygenase family protein [Sorangium sp. So ce1036]|uniref:styrene monooxygenase/indole monooxygenase family protein n=1 Tax=Sorangium sp. So ce1036 TaxID=3133328 RepID=UPI003F00F509